MHNVCMYVYIYIYMCVCHCMSKSSGETNHMIHIIYCIYIYIITHLIHVYIYTVYHPLLNSVGLVVYFSSATRYTPVSSLSLVINSATLTAMHFLGEFHGLPQLRTA